MTCGSIVGGAIGVAGSIAGAHAARGGKYQHGWTPPPMTKRPPYPFPRSREKRIARMERFIEWKREKITERRWRHLWLFMLWTCAPPIALTIIGLCWKLLLWVGLA